MKKLSYIFLSILLSTAFLGGTAFTLVNGIDTTYDPYILIYRSNPGNKYVAKYIKKDVTPSAPPIVNAGADTTLPIGQDSVELLGSAFSDAGIQSYSWTQISGSTSDIISPSNAHTLIKNFSGDGNYVYRLTATDINGLTGYDDITVKISSANIVLIMPEDQELKHDSSWSFLQATASYSGGSIANYQWTQVSGHNVTINTPNKDSTSIYGYLTTIDTSNYYKFKLVVTSSDDTKDSGYVTVMVDSTTLKPGEYFVNSSRSVAFNFTPVAQSIEGYVDVIGDPSKSVVTATAPNGISISSIGSDSTLWNSSPLLDNKSAGIIGMTYTTPSDPYGYQEFDSSVITTGWINWNSQYVPGTYNLRISGLDPNSIYQLQMIGSITYTDSTSANQYSTRTNYRTNTGQSFSLNTQFRTSKAIVEDTVHANASGQIYLSVTGQDTTYSNGSSGVLSALRIYHISRDSVTGTQRTALYKTYYDTVYINDGTVDRLCIVYLPYNYNSSESYPLFVYLDGQEDAVKDYNWDPQVLTGDGIGIVAEHEKGKLYGLRENGDTASFFTLFPQTSLNEWSLTPTQIHTLITNFKARFSGTYDINDSTFIAGFSSGGIGAVNYLYKYPSEVTGAFIQSPAPDGTYQMPTPATLRDTSAKFDEYGTHVWLSAKQDGFGDEIDSIKKYIDLANPYNEYYRYWGRDHSGFASEYTYNKVDPLHNQTIYDFFFNPTDNGRQVGFFAFKNDGNGIPDIYTNVVGSPVYNQPSQGSLTGTNELGWTLTTGSTSKFSGTTYRGQGAGAASVNLIRLLPYYTNSYILGNGSIINAKTGGYASNGYNMTLSGLKPDSTYVLYFSGSGAQDGDYHTTYTVDGNSVSQDNTQLRETMFPVSLQGTADGSGNIQIGFYPENSGDTAVLAYMIAKEKYGTAAPYVNAGVDQTITLPTSSASLSGTAFAFTGTITSTTWSVIDNPNGSSPSISNASALSTTVSGLSIEGDYKLQLSATDGTTTVKDTMIITVNPEPSGGGGPSVLFNFNKTTQSVSGTVDVSGSPQGSVISVTDPTTGWGINSVATSAWPAFGPFSSANDNGGDTDDGGGFVFGTDVTRSSWYSQGKDTTSGPTRRLQITGLDDTKTYTLSFLSSIDPTIGAPNGQTVWYHINEVAGTFKQSVVVDNNSSNLVKYSGLVPSSGIINIDMNNTSTSVFVIVNGLKIEQE